MDNKNIIIMKVGPHSGMALDEIVESKIQEEKNHKVHYWGYSGVFCHPKKVQEFCEECEKTNSPAKLILIETKSSYQSDIGFIDKYSINGVDYEKFKYPVQLQGAQYSFVTKNIKKIENFPLHKYVVVGGKNDSKPILSHLRYRVNKSFAKLANNIINNKEEQFLNVLEAELVYPYAIWLKDKK